MGRRLIPPSAELTALEPRVLLSAQWRPMPTFPLLQYPQPIGPVAVVGVASSVAGVAHAGGIVPGSTTPATSLAQATVKPFAVAAATPSLADRYDLLSHWGGSNAAALKALLDANNTAGFDSTLLTYMKGRSGLHFQFLPSDVAGYISFIQGENRFDTQVSTVISDANDICNHLFPLAADSASNTVQLGSSINWLAPLATPNNSFTHSLNEHAFWIDLALAYGLTGNVKYVNEIINQLVSWSQQNPPLAKPDDWQTNDPLWYLLDVGTRADNWSWAYSLVLSTGGWTPAANTLFLQKLWQHGDFLRRVTPNPPTSNWTLTHGQGLCEIATLVPEFKESADWQTYGRTLLFNAIDTQFYPDGGQDEESPMYLSSMVDKMLETEALAAKNGLAWSSTELTRLQNACEALYQLLQPDGSKPALSDSYRTTGLTVMSKARMTFGNARWPYYGSVKIRDVFLFAPGGVTNALGATVTPTLANRGTNYALPDLGYYIMRSDTSRDARQLIFDAGPNGYVHGHADLLNFELYGYQKALIADPGLLRYDNSADRAYVVSTPAHNTIFIDNVSHGAMEGDGNPGIVVDQWDVASDHMQITAHQYGYQYLAGRPVVGRSIWYDKSNTYLIVDWGEGNAAHDYYQSFTLPTTSASTVTNGQIYSTTGSGDVMIQSLLLPGQSARRMAAFTSSRPAPNEKDAAVRFTVTQNGSFVAFATLVTTYTGARPNVTASWVNSPVAGQPIQLRLTKNGSSQTVTFNPPALQRLGKYASADGTYNDLAYDASGNLHYAWYDLSEHDLKYAMRDTAGKWSIAEIVDSAANVGQYLSMALDQDGNPAIAYTDAYAGDLKCAAFDGKVWKVETVDSKGSVGLYPSVQFGGNNRAVITYYDRTHGDLKMAINQGNLGWSISALDSGKSGADVGRYSSLVRGPSSGRWCVAYENTSAGSFQYAYQTGTGWQFQTIDNTTKIGGGYISLAFDSSGNPAVSYYDAYNADLKYAHSSGSSWSAQTVSAKGMQGTYSNLYFKSNQPTIVYYNRTGNALTTARLGSGWSLGTLQVGGRNAAIALDGSGHLAYSRFDDGTGLLDVHVATA